MCLIYDFLQYKDHQHSVITLKLPGDVRSESLSACADLSTARERGKKLFGEMQFQAALFEYWQSLRSHSSEVAILLSNRAQSAIKQERWEHALRDSASALLLCPGKKHWERYAMAASGLGFMSIAIRARGVQSPSSSMQQPTLDDVRSVLQAGFGIASVAPLIEFSGDLKEQGNTAYRCGRFAEAEVLYTTAIDRHDDAEDIAVILSNVSLCSLRAGLLHDSVAAAAASLTLRVTQKAKHHLATALAYLGEFDLSEEIFKDNAQMSEHCKAVVQAKQHVAQGYPKELVAEALIGGWRGWEKSIVGEWVSDSLEIFKSPEKGLGVRTKCQILGGTTLIVQRPRAFAAANAEKDKEILTSLNTTARLVDDASKVKLASQISSAASKDMLLARTVSCLDDGLGKDRQVVGFNMLLDQLQPVVLPFLLQQPEFFPEKERLEISHASVQGVVSVNCHGSNSERTFKSRLNSSGTSLYPAISLINHSSSPNCALIPITPSDRVSGSSGASGQEDVPVALIVGANRDLRQGTELTLCYINDADAVKRKWNISE